MAAGSTTPNTSHADFATPVTSSILSVSPTLPPLEQGDRLTRAEFERRYDAMEGLKKAELIDGVVHMPSPVRFAQHGSPHTHLIGWLFNYEAHTPGVAAGDNASLRFDNDNLPQPDALLMITKESGGQSGIDTEGYIKGPPELVAEIASSSTSIDMHDKLNVYRRTGVREYIVWRVLDRAIDWFELREGEYKPLAVGNDGIIRSEIFPGLWLNALAMIDGKLDAVVATVQQGVSSDDHTQFVVRLAQHRKAAQP